MTKIIVRFLVLFGFGVLTLACVGGCGPGAGTYCQSGPKYGTQCYSPMDLQPPGSPPPPAGGPSRH